MEYFTILDETSKIVDPYVREFIDIHFSTTGELKDIFMKQYRFGKPQLRPVQVRLAYELVGGTHRENIVPACASVEIKDTGYYCYDTVLDLGGDLKLSLTGGMFVILSHIVAQELFNNFNSVQVHNVLKELFELDKNNMQGAIIDGQLKKEINNVLYMEKADKYNFREHALKIGGILGGGSPSDIEKLSFIGKKIGTAYIIANDTWDFGKDLEDFRAGKYTLPIIRALENTIEADRKVLLSFFGQNILSEEEIRKIRRIMVTSQAIDFGKNTAQELCNEGIEKLHDFKDSHAKRMLEFSTTMTQKNKYYDVLKNID